MEIVSNLFSRWQQISPNHDYMDMNLHTLIKGAGSNKRSKKTSRDDDVKSWARSHGKIQVKCKINHKKTTNIPSTYFVLLALAIACIPTTPVAHDSNGFLRAVSKNPSDRTPIFLRTTMCIYPVTPRRFDVTL